MSADAIHEEIQSVVDAFGPNPLHFFWILREESNNENLEFARQNEAWDFVRKQSWHSLDLGGYQLWALSDNGDLLWWNGDQTIAMAPRNFEFFSVHVSPLQFLRLLKVGEFASFFPEDLLDGCS